MDPIEKAIRSAFEKGNAEDKAFRESIYRKAFAALDRALQANPNLTVEAAISRRKVLQAKIVEIETEFGPAAARPVPVAFEARQEPGTASPTAPEVRVDAQAPSTTAFVPAAGRPVPAATDPLAGAFEVRMEAGAAAPIAPEVRVDEQAPSRQPGLPGDLGGLDVAADRPTAPIFTGPLDTASEVQPDPDAARSRRRSRPFAIFFIAATLLALLGMGLWFASQTGLFRPLSERDTSVPNPPSNESEDFIPENEEPPVLSSEPEAQRDWISIFAPDAASSVSAPTGTTAEAKQDESGSFIRIRSGDSGAAVVFDVGQDVLERIAGKKATFDINARAADGEDTEMAVDCDFGELGDCGRKRYALGYERADFLFELQMPAAQPGAGGSIAIVSDFANSGKSVDIYEIKVSVAP